MISYPNQDIENKQNDLDTKKMELYQSLITYYSAKFDVHSKLSLTDSLLMDKIKARKLDFDNTYVSKFFDALEYVFIQLKDFLKLAKSNVDPNQEKLAQLNIYFKEIKDLRNSYVQAYYRSEREL